MADKCCSSNSHDDKDEQGSKSCCVSDHHNDKVEQTSKSSCSSTTTSKTTNN